MSTDDRPRGRQVRRLVLQVAEAMGADVRDPAAVVPCSLCGAPVLLAASGNDPSGPSLDHRVPRSRGGTDDLDNLSIVHRACNTSKGNRPHPGPVDVGPRSRKW